mgnify:FL=1
MTVKLYLQIFIQSLIFFHWHVPCTDIVQETISHIDICNYPFVSDLLPLVDDIVHCCTKCCSSFYNNNNNNNNSDNNNYYFFSK